MSDLHRAAMALSATLFAIHAFAAGW